MEKERIILVGHAASGKDYAKELLQNKLGLTYGVSYTSRPPRVGEIEGKDYFFRDENFFKEKIKEKAWYEYVIFNKWYYGTLKSQFYGKDNVFIMTPKGLAHLNGEDREKSLVIFFDIPEDIRYERISKRKGNADSIDRRIEADKVDFMGFSNYDQTIKKPDFSIKDIKHIINIYSPNIKFYK